MKQITFFLLIVIFFGFFVCPAISKEANQEGAIIIGCELSTRKNKKIYKEGKKIDFILSCSSENSEYLFFPRRFLQGTAEFKPHIIFENEEGKQYEFLYYRYAFLGTDTTFEVLKSGSDLYQFRVPDNRARYRFIERGAWDETASFHVEERRNIVDAAPVIIPAGKYKAWVDLRHEWRTVKIGNAFMIFEDYNNHDNRAEVISWKIDDVTPVIEFEVKEKKRMFGNKE